MEVLLGLLAIEPMSGYDLGLTIRASVGHFWNESYGQIYPNLKKLETERFVISKTERQKGKPDRRGSQAKPIWTRRGVEGGVSEKSLRNQANHGFLAWAEDPLGRKGALPLERMRKRWRDGHSGVYSFVAGQAKCKSRPRLCAVRCVDE
jgi:hypothetical protein